MELLRRMSKINIKDFEKYIGDKKKANKKESLEDVLNKLDKETLISIILNLSGKDKRIKEELLLFYSPKIDILETALKVIRSSIDAVTRRGYVEYDDASLAVSGAHTVLKMINDRIESRDFLTAVSLGVVVLEEMMDLMDYCDDSGGNVGGVIVDAIKAISSAVCTMNGALPGQSLQSKQFTIDEQKDNDRLTNDSQKDIERFDKVIQKENEQFVKDEQKNNERLANEAHTNRVKVFDIVFNHAIKSTYDGWTDWRMDLLQAIASLCDNSVNRDKMEEYIFDVVNLNEDGRIGMYNRRRLQRIQHAIIEQFDGGAAASLYMENNLENEDFRRIAITAAITEGLYEKAISLCLDGENKDAGYVEMVRDWKQLRYSIYEKTGDISAQRSLGLEFVLDGEFDYFPKLKALYAKDEWDSVLQNVLSKLQDLDGYRQTSTYIKIIIHEKLKYKLLEYCRNHISEISFYYQHLLPEYKREVGTIFVQHIRDRASGANNRNSYSKVCDLIRHYIKACGKAANKLRDDLEAEYTNRPAFLEELRKIDVDV